MYGENGSDHNAMLKELLKRARKKTCKFNPDKLMGWDSEIPFFGHIISKDGIKPEHKKVKAIMHLKPLKDKKQLASFLGLVNYLNKISSPLARLTKPLWDLMPKDIEFTWTPQQEEVFESIKKRD